MNVIMKNIEHYEQRIIIVFIILFVLFFTAAFTVFKTNGAVITISDWLREKKERAVTCEYIMSTNTGTYTGSVNGSFNKGNTGPMDKKGGHEAMKDESRSKNTDGTGCSHLPGAATLLCGVTTLNRRTLRVRTC
jgi:hypothetical protein